MRPPLTTHGPSSLHQERSSGATPSPLQVADLELPA